MSWTTRQLLPSKFLLVRSFKTSFSTTIIGCRRPKPLLNYFSRHNRWESSLRTPIDLQYLYYSSKTTKSTRCSRADLDGNKLEVFEFPVSNLNGCDDEDDVDGVLYTYRRSSNNKTSKTEDSVWNMTNTNSDADDSTLRIQLQTIPKKIISLLLPAQYPQSVARGYLGFISYSFIASIAGSSAMVLSTQTLLLAVGIVAQNSAPQASIMAGALNWVLKDFIGQLGGIVFASQMGKTKAFDSDPKRWRMVSAIALDGATLMEILSPLVHQSLVLPVASIANIGKNIGFLTASASRAALHQSLAITGNLGDVTVKAGSQSMMASLVGTSLGIGLSTLLQHDTFNFGICFVCLSAIHQGCTYLSLRNVPLDHFNRHRLQLAIEGYLQTEKLPNPIDVAKVERFFPFLASDFNSDWLNIGRPLREVCRNPSELENFLSLAPNEAYLIRFHENTHEIDLIYFNDAKEKDLFRGMYHACLIRYTCQMATGSATATATATATSKMRADQSTNRQATNDDISCEEITRQTHIQVQEDFPYLFAKFHAQGWNTASGVTIVEDSNANRICIKI